MTKARLCAAEMLALRLVPDDMWLAIEDLVPAQKVRPQGGGRSRVDSRIVFAALAYVLAQDVAWRRLPAEFGVSVPTVYRRFVELTDVGFWSELRGRCDYGTDWGRWAHDLARRAESRLFGPDTLVEGDAS